MPEETSYGLRRLIAVRNRILANERPTRSHGADALYGAWLEKNVYTTALIYCGLIAVLLPGFHFVLRVVPGVPPDSMALRLVAAGVSLCIAAVLLRFRKARRYANALQFLNVVTAIAVIAALVVNSGDQYMYIASGLLVIIGAQQAFYRPADLAAALALGFLFQCGYSYARGIFFTPVNLVAIVVYATGYILAFIPAYVRMRIQQSEIYSRLEAIEVRSELEAVHAITHLGNWVVELQNGATEWSPELLRIFRMPLDTPGDTLRGAYELAIHAGDRRTVDRALETAIKSGGTFTVEHRLHIADRTTRWVQLQGRYHYDESGNPLKRIAAVVDITERKDAEERLRHLAAYDLLTGLPNRATLEEYLQATISRGEACALLFLDMDRFKDINDTLGHAIGDELLRAVAERLSLLRPSNAILARWGGDEFILALNGAGREGATQRFAQRLIGAIAEPFEIDGYDLVISASVGIACAPRDGASAGVIIRNADTAMYYAKEHARDGWAFFEPQMHQAASARHHVQNELHKATWNNTLSLHYQPIIDVTSGEVVSAEALLRWTGDDGVMRYPRDFISIAEDTGEIVSIGRWALQNACRQIEVWQREDRPISVAVNVSARQLERPDFIETLRTILEQTPIDATLLDIEVTESALLSNTAAVFETLEQIRLLGPRISIDDFGTGYSTFAYLKRFRVDALKLDGSFISGIDRPADRAIAESIVSVAHTLGLRVIAEGVEQAHQLSVLAQLGCDRAQGFYISRPAALNDFEWHMTSQAARLS